MIRLYLFGPYFGLPDPSPFVLKSLVQLKMAGLAFESVPISNLLKAPKGKLPFIEDEGQRIADSTFIRLHIERKYGVDLNAGLSAQQQAIAWAVEKMVEEHLYWAILDVRWRHRANFDRGPRHFFDRVPALLRPLVIALVRRKAMQAMKGHGFGLHSSAEVAELSIRDLQAIADIMGEQDYLMGSQPCGADAAVFAMLSGLMLPMFDSPIREAAESMPTLVAYRDRTMARYFAS